MSGLDNREIENEIESWFPRQLKGNAQITDLRLACRHVIEYINEDIKEPIEGNRFTFFHLENENELSNLNANDGDLCAVESNKTLWCHYQDQWIKLNDYLGGGDNTTEDIQPVVEKFIIDTEISESGEINLSQFPNRNFHLDLFHNGLMLTPDEFYQVEGKTIYLNKDKDFFEIDDLIVVKYYF